MTKQSEEHICRRSRPASLRHYARQDKHSRELAPPWCNGAAHQPPPDPARKNNGDAVTEVCRELIVLCKQVSWGQPLDLAEVKARAKALGGTINNALLYAETVQFGNTVDKTNQAV